MNEITLQDRGGIPVVSSRDVAENFGKQHQHITQSIENLISEKSLLKTMLIEHEYTSERGRVYKEYLLTRDGFSLLVMGFTGSKALEWKLKYIEAFNKMEEHIKSGALALPTTYKEALKQLLEQVEKNEELEVLLKWKHLAECKK